MNMNGIQSSSSKIGEFLTLPDDNSIPTSFDIIELGPFKHTNYLKRELFHLFGIQTPSLDNLNSREKDLTACLSKLLDKSASLLKQNQNYEQIKNRAEEEIQKVIQEVKQVSSELEALKNAKKQSEQISKDTIKKLQSEIKQKATRVTDLEKEILQKEKDSNFLFQNKLSSQIKTNFILPNKLKSQEKKGDISLKELFVENMQKQIKEYKKINEMLYESISSLSESLREACLARRSFMKETFEVKSEKLEAYETIEKTFRLISTSSKSSLVNIESPKILLETIQHFISFVDSFDNLVCPAFSSFKKTSNRKGSGMVDLDSVYRSRKLTTVRQVRDMQNLLEEIGGMVDEYKSLIDTAQDFEKLGDTSLGHRSIEKLGSHKFSTEKKASASDLMTSYFQQQFCEFEDLKQRYKEADDRLALELRGLSELAYDFTGN